LSEQTARQVRFYLDFVSPYTYLALVRAQGFASRYDVKWNMRPVVYGRLLDSTGLIGPVEKLSKRLYTYRDIKRSADMLDVPLVGPPEHPFRSLEALRTLCLFRHDDKALDLASSLAAACWGEGRPLTDILVLEEIVAGLGLDSSALGERIASSRVKQDLHDLTHAALERGVFGVPTFEYDHELFWGHDRLEHLAARLSGRLSAPGPELEELSRRPQGAVRRAAPHRTDSHDS
jgi:2-hydroxychromene-2-carboxylate isomerase